MTPASEDRPRLQHFSSIGFRGNPIETAADLSDLLAREYTRMESKQFVAVCRGIELCCRAAILMAEADAIFEEAELV